MTLTISNTARRITRALNEIAGRPFGDTVYFDAAGQETGRHQTGMRYKSRQDVPEHTYAMTTNASTRHTQAAVQEHVTAVDLLAAAGLTHPTDLDALLEEWRFDRDCGRAPRYDEDPAALRDRMLSAAQGQLQVDEAADQAALADFERAESTAAPTI